MSLRDTLPLGTVIGEFAMSEAADRLEGAIATVLDQGIRTGDIYTAGMRKVGTREMGDAILKALD